MDDHNSWFLGTRCSAISATGWWQGGGVQGRQAEGEVPCQELQPVPHHLVASRAAGGQEGSHQNYAPRCAQDQRGALPRRRSICVQRLVVQRCAEVVTTEAVQ